MTTEQKAKAYDEALNIAKETYETQPMYRAWLEKMFPELRESEDEKMTRVISLALTDVPEERFTSLGTTSRDCLAYLKKQKEQKPALTPERIRPKFAVGDTVCRPMWSDHTIREIYVRCNDPVYVCVNEEGTESHIPFSEQDEWERKEQKPAEWSEEDEKMLQRIIRHTESEYQDWCNDKYGNSEIVSDGKRSCLERLDWLEKRLKSLRPSWKPSEEQMEAMEFVIKDYREDGCIATANYLQEILDQIKKL